MYRWLVNGLRCWGPVVRGVRSRARSPMPVLALRLSVERRSGP